MKLHVSKEWSMEGAALEEGLSVECCDPMKCAHCGAEMFWRHVPAAGALPVPYCAACESLQRAVQERPDVRKATRRDLEMFGIHCLAILALALTSCSTTISNGSFRFTTYANAARLRVVGPGIVFEADGLRHSTPTAAAFTGASHLAASIGAASLPFVGGVPAAVRVLPVIPASAPHFRTNPSNQ